jgi:clan AA aspartic protease (TIGR02281 family)
VRPLRHRPAPVSLFFVSLFFVSLFFGMALSACSRGGSYAIAPFEAVPPLRNGAVSDPTGKLYGDQDQVRCNLALTSGPVELPARMCVRAGGTIEGEAFHPQQPKIPPEPSPGAIEVPLNRHGGGGYYVPVKINDALTLDFLIDSGAATVSMPADVVQALVRLGTLAPGDVQGSKDYKLADGSIRASQTFQIRSLQVGDTVLQGVTGSMAPVNGGLLLGQSFLSRFRSWSIDNGKQMLVLDGRW